MFLRSSFAMAKDHLLPKLATKMCYPQIVSECDYFAIKRNNLQGLELFASSLLSVNEDDHKRDVQHLRGGNNALPRSNGC